MPSLCRRTCIDGCGCRAACVRFDMSTACVNVCTLLHPSRTNRCITMSSSHGRASTVQRNILLLLLLQLVMMVYVLCPYYVSPYVFNSVDLASASNSSLQLANATFKQRSVPWLSARVLPRVLSTDEHDEFIRLLRATDSFLRDHNITYALFYGSLVGSYVMHDIIPWDDDVDFVVKLAENEKLEQAMQVALHKYKLSYILDNALRATTYKLFFTDGRSAGQREWKWPFVDLAFYGENSTHVWNTNADGVLPLIIPREWFYPLIPRPFASLWLPAPHETSLLLRQHYGGFTCKRFAWNHKDEQPWWSTAYAPCHTLTDFYPFVWRTLINDTEEGAVLETLKLGERELYSVRINNTRSSGNSSPFEF